MAARQHGVVSRSQLLTIGFTGGDVRRLRDAGLLHRVHRGIFHVGHDRPTRLARYQSAALLCGACAGVSHRGAAVLRGVLAEDGRPVEVSSPTSSGGWRDGVRVHERRRLARADLSPAQGIRTVSLEWAMLDVAAVAPREFALLFDAADRQRRIDPQRLARQLARGRDGSAVVRARLDEYAAPTLTDSALEEQFMANVVRRFGLPAPLPQAAPFARRRGRVDFAWPGRRVVVELDGRAWHAIQSQWGEDHERDLELRRLGWTVLRYTPRQLSADPAGVAADVARALARPAG